MNNIFADLQKCTFELRGTLTQAIMNDRQEISMTLSMASKMGLSGAAATVAAALAQTAMHGATMKGKVALAQIHFITNWAEQSKDSSRRLRHRGQEWARLRAEVQELRDLMKEVQRRGINNEWSGDAKQQWQAFTDRQIKEHSKFQEAVSKVPPLLFDAGNATDTLLSAFVAVAQVALLSGTTIASRPPMPNPAGFGIGTRTPELASLLGWCADLFSNLQNGSWRGWAMGVSMRLALAGCDMRVSAGRVEP